MSDIEIAILTNAAPSELDRIADREVVRYAVQKKIFCDKCKGALDMRTTVYAVVTLPVRGEAKRLPMVVHGKCWDEVAPLRAKWINDEGATIEETDGRRLWKR